MQAAVKWITKTINWPIMGPYNTPYLNICDIIDFLIGDFPHFLK